MAVASLPAPGEGTSEPGCFLGTGSLQNYLLIGKAGLW